jgi:hypothetical protein
MFIFTIDQDLWARELIMRSIMSIDYSLDRKDIHKFILSFYDHISVQ